MQAANGRARIRIVQSRGNARLKELRAAFAATSRSASREVAVEGEHLLLEALRSRLRLATVFVRTGSEALIDRLVLPENTDLVALSPELFGSAVATEHPQGIAALVEAPEFRPEDLLSVQSPLVLVLAGLQDPGNLGTLVRSAEAFGASGILALPGTVSLWNQKALRASSGSAFRMPFLRMTDDEALSFLRSHRVPIAATVARGGLDANAVDLAGPLALLIGNEGAGLAPHWIAAADHRITIPCPGPVESLNAAVAGSVLLYECARQRAAAPNGGAAAHRLATMEACC